MAEEGQMIEPGTRHVLADPTVRIIGPRRPGVRERVREIWTFRRLVRYFARRYVQKGYQRTWLGWLWLPLRPALSIGSRVLVFGGLLRAPSDGVPYLLFFLVGTSAWEVLDRTAYFATRSIELNRRVLTRVYIPRLTALLGAVAPSALNFLLYLGISIGAAIGYGIADDKSYLAPGWGTLLAIAGLLLTTMMALGIGLWTAPYAAQARDVRFALRYLLSFWYFLTPVIYSLSAIPPRYRGIASFNPMTAPMQMVKRGILGVGDVPTSALWVTFGTIIVLVGGGLVHFGRAEAVAVDSL